MTMTSTHPNQMHQINTPQPLSPVTSIRSFIDNDSDSDTDIDGMIEPLTSNQQLQIFVSGYMPNEYPQDIILLISNIFLDLKFKWNLGVLEWRTYTSKTKAIIKEIYGYMNNTNDKILKLINYAISKCICHKQVCINIRVQLHLKIHILFT